MKKSRLTAAFLSLFLGAFGAHKFYLRETGAGFFYLFLLFLSSRFRFPLTTILGIVDAIRLFSMDDEVFDRKYNKEQVQERDFRNNPRKYSRLKVKKEENTYRYTGASKKRENPFKGSGLIKLKDYDVEGAIEDLTKALEISPKDADIHFAMASAYSLIEKKEKAYYHLEESVRLGLKDKDKIMDHDALAFLRIQEDFDAFRANGYKRPAENAPPAEEMPKDDLLLSQLNKLKDLRSKGLLSQKEFVFEKEKLLRK